MVGLLWFFYWPFALAWMAADKYIAWRRQREGLPEHPTADEPEYANRFERIIIWLICMPTFMLMLADPYFNRLKERAYGRDA